MDHQVEDIKRSLAVLAALAESLSERLSNFRPDENLPNKVRLARASRLVAITTLNKSFAELEHALERSHVH